MESFQNIKNELIRLQNEETPPRPFLNWTTYYGGIISPKLYNNIRFRKWAISQQLTYLVNDQLPIMTKEGEYQYNQEYEKDDPEVFEPVNPDDDGFFHDVGPVIDG